MNLNLIYCKLIISSRSWDSQIITSIVLKKTIKLPDLKKTHLFLYLVVLLRTRIDIVVFW